MLFGTIETSQITGVPNFPRNALVMTNACFTIQAILLDPNMNMGEKIQAIMNTVKEHAGEIVKVTFSLQLPQSYGKRCRKSKMSAFIIVQSASLCTKNTQLVIACHRCMVRSIEIVIGT